MLSTGAVVIESCCRELMGTYLTSVDSRDIERLLRTFAPDALWVRPGMAPMRSHAAIRAFLEAINEKHKAESPNGHLTRHLLTTLSITLLDHDRASGVAYALVFRVPQFDGHLPAPMPGPELVVEYRDIFENTELGWRIAHHEARHIFRSAQWTQLLTVDELKRLGLSEGSAT